MGQQQDFLAQLMDLLLVQINTSAVVILSSREGVCGLFKAGRRRLLKQSLPTHIHSFTLPHTVF